ncbi:hypothetical protein CK203_038420 [Vitis vinifera]|uniref:Uncharacterized protein n=1 Tax=Vitis vinifera TaxID=29760 RepID=A0A438IRV4_VITVI|nr:hypothetical protein CK203_038420 [Vitis vinifera]
MTTRGVPSPTSIHFTFDGRHGVPNISEGHGPHFIQGDLYRFDPFSEGAFTWDVPHRCGATLQTSFPYNIRYKGEKLSWMLCSAYQRASTLTHTT